MNNYDPFQGLYTNDEFNISGQNVNEIKYEDEYS